MLTRLEVDGFKTFENLGVEFMPLTAILGDNASGKSNLFDVIQLLSKLATRDVMEAVKPIRGEPLELFRQTPSGQARQIRLAAEVLVDPVVRNPWGSQAKLTHTRLRYEVTLERREIRPGFERIQIAHEAALPIMRKDDNWAEAQQPSRDFRRTYLKYSRQKPWLTTTPSENGLEFNIHQDGKGGRSRPASAATATILYSVTSAEQFPHLFALREEMRSWRLLQLAPALLREASPATANDTLNDDGANLAAVLTRLKAETRTDMQPKGVLSDIAAVLNNLVPGAGELDVELDDASRTHHLELTSRDKIPCSSRTISDGILRMTALLSLLHDPRHRGLVCIEEPENGIHPCSIRPLTQHLQSMVTDPASCQGSQTPLPLKQLILNSHSPVLFSALMNHSRPGAFQALNGGVIFADTATSVDPDRYDARHHTRLRPVDSAAQPTLPGIPGTLVHPTEALNILESIPSLL